VIVLIATTLGGGDDNGSGDRPGRTGHAAQRHGGAPPPKRYVVENGDTLTSIAHETGVSVARILSLNPGVDPQILVSGETLKLR
jgi:LysM repeat protein